MFNLISVFCFGVFAGVIVTLIIIAGLTERHFIKNAGLQADSPELKLHQEDRAGISAFLDTNNALLQDILEENKRIWTAIQIRWPK